MQDIHIKEYFYQVWKRRNVVLIVLSVVLALTLLVSARQTKIYRAICVIEIGAETPDAMFQDVMNISPYGWWSALKYYETQYKILKSRSLLEKVAERAIDRQVVKGISKDSLTAKLQSNLTVASDENSRLVSLYFEDTSQDQAKDLVNLVAEVYVDENLAQKLQGITQAVKWLTDRLDEIRAEKHQQEEELQKFKEEYKVVSVEDRSSSARSNLNALSESLNRIKNQRIELEAQYSKLRDLVTKSERAEDLLGVVSNEVLSRLKMDLSTLTSERSKLSSRYLDKHPTMVQLSAQISEVEKAIKDEVSNEVGRLKTKFLLALAQENEIAKALEKQKLEAIKIEEVTRRVADIQVVTNTNQQLFEALQKRLKEVDLSGLMRSNNIRIVDRALLPGGPVRPNIRRNLMMALLVGFLGGIGLALTLEYLDDTLRSQEDVEAYLQLPVLGVIPHYRGTGNGAEVTPIDFVPLQNPTSPVAEFFRTLRTNLLFLSATRGSKKFLFVSTGPGEGKTSLSINLAITMAQMGQKTVLVELDLRRPKLHTKFQVDSRVGITNFLAGEATLKEIVRSSDVPNLDFILCGAIPPNPAELLASEGLKRILDDLSKIYDRVIIDSSPIAPVTDAVIISQQCDGVLFVVRTGKTHRRAARLALEQMKTVKADLLGVILNDVDVEKTSYGNYQYYKYGYSSYGAESSKTEPQLPAI